MSSYAPPTINNQVFNASAFNYQDGAITYHQGDARYILKTGNITATNASITNLTASNATIGVITGNTASFNTLNGTYIYSDTTQNFIHNTGYKIAGGRANTLFGNTSGSNITTGIYNSAYGCNSLKSLTTGSNNTAVGYFSLYSNTGNSNTAIGTNSGKNNSTGTQNTFIGYNTNITGGFSYSTAIGYNTTITGNNQIILGTAGETTYIAGSLNIVGNTTAGNISGAFYGDISGNITGTNGAFTTITGTNGIFTTITGYLIGDVSGNITGTNGTFTTITGNLNGDVSGNITGTNGTFTTITGYLKGDVSGNITGTNGTFTNITGTLTGRHYGDVFGNITGTSGTLTNITNTALTNSGTITTPSLTATSAYINGNLNVSSNIYIPSNGSSSIYFGTAGNVVGRIFGTTSSFFDYNSYLTFRPYSGFGDGTGSTSIIFDINGGITSSTINGLSITTNTGGFLLSTSKGNGFVLYGNTNTNTYFQYDATYSVYNFVFNGGATMAVNTSGITLNSGGIYVSNGTITTPNLQASGGNFSNYVAVGSSSSTGPPLSINDNYGTEMRFLTNMVGGSYNNIVQNGDEGIIFSTKGAISSSFNVNSQAFVIAPWNNYAIGGGIRITQTELQINNNLVSLVPEIYYTGSNGNTSYTGSYSPYQDYGNWSGKVGYCITQNLNTTNRNGAFDNMYSTDFINNSGSANYSCWLFYSMGSAQTTAVSWNCIYNGGFAHTSDKTTKQNIKNLNTKKSLDKILKLRPVNYQYIQDPSSQRIGFISQEVEEINPLSTVELPHTKDTSGNTINKLSLNYQDLFIHNIGATQELYKMIQVLQEQVTTLQEQVAKLTK